MKAAELFVKSLEAEGVEYVFGVPGEENLDLLEALRNSKIKFIITRHEQAAVFMAATFGRLTGKAGVALSTLGPGATNLVTGIAHAQLGGMPLILITGQKPIRASKQGKFQIINVVRMLEPITKLSGTVYSADRIPSIVREAFKLAEAERPGAVHIELPEDIAREETKLEPILPAKVRRPGPDPKAIAAAVALIEAAKQPLILAASGANRKLIRKHLHNFLEKTQIPFITTQMGKGVEDESSPLYLGNAALTSNDFVHQALSHSDLIIVIGHDIIEKPPAILGTRQAGPQVIHINFAEAEVDSVYIPDLEVVGDISHALWAITEQIKPQPHWDFKYFEKVRTALQNQIAEKSDSAEFPLKPQRLVAELRKVMPADGILSLDNGMYKIWIARNYPAYQQNTVLLDNALATMGAGLPAGIAAKILHPERKVVVVAGDGGVMMNISELETAKRLGLDLVILILNDSGFGMIKWKQEEMRLPGFGLEFNNPDFVKLAESFGGQGQRIAKAEEFEPALRRALDAKGIQIIDCPVDYSENGLVFGVDLKNQTEKI